jgi:hypothetical protein
VSGKKEKTEVSLATQLKKIEKDRKAVVKAITEAAQAEATASALAEATAAADAAIAEQVRVDNAALRQLPTVGQGGSASNITEVNEVNEIDELLVSDGLVEVPNVVSSVVSSDINHEQLESRICKLEKIVLKLNITKNDLLLNITDERSESNAKLTKQFVSRVYLDRKVDKVAKDLREVIESLKSARRGRSTTPQSPLAGSASRKRSAKD